MAHIHRGAFIRAIESFVILLSVSFIIGLGGCGASSRDEACMSIGSSVDGPIDGNAYLHDLLLTFGPKHAHEFKERYAIDRKASELKVALSPGQLDAEMALALRSFYQSHSSEAAAVKHLEGYGLSLENWKMMTRRRLKYQLLLKEIMKKQPSERMLEEHFERRFGKGGVRREIRYLHVSTELASQSVLPKEEVEGILESTRKDIESTLEEIVGKQEMPSKLFTGELKKLDIGRSTKVRRTDLPLNMVAELDRLAPGIWGPVHRESQFIKVARKPLDSPRNGAAARVFEEFAVNISDERLLNGVLGDKIRLKASKRAEELFAAINRKPERFALEARLKSDHKLSGNRGGRYQIFLPEQSGLPENVIEEILKLEIPNQLILKETNNGFHLIRLDSIKKVDLKTVRQELLLELSRRDHSAEQMAAYHADLILEFRFQLEPKLSARCSAKKGTAPPE